MLRRAPHSVMDFQKRLLEISGSLGNEEVQDLCFLCADLLPQNLSWVEQATDLFDCLTKRGLLTAENCDLLTELLRIIGRHVLVKEHLLPQHNQISAYRRLLYDLNRSITNEQLRDMKFLLSPKLCQKKLENATTLQLFQEMENAELLCKSDFKELESIFQSVYPALNKKIDDYKTRIVVSRTPVPEEKEHVDSGLFRNTTDDPKRAQEEKDAENLSNKLEPLGIEEEGSADSKMQQEEKSCSQALSSYRMKLVKRSTCVIINNENFTGLETREGTLLDEQFASIVFEWLNFEVKVHRDCDRKKILSVIKDSAAEDHSQVDCLVYMVFSHGLEGYVVGVDGEPVTFRELMEPFTGAKCRSLAGKPKMFFVQACQGNNHNAPVNVESDSVPSDAGTREKIPSEADFLLGKSTVPTYCSYRDKKTGSWFIQTLCQHLIKLVPDGVDLLSIMTKVNEVVSQMTDDTGMKKQMPNFESSLRKNVVFPIPEATPPEL